RTRDGHCQARTLRPRGGHLGVLPHLGGAATAPRAARRSDAASITGTATGITHQAATPTAATTAVRDSAITTPRAVRQSSPTMNSHTRDRIRLAELMRATPPARWLAVRPLRAQPRAGGSSGALSTPLRSRPRERRG